MKVNYTFSESLIPINSPTNVDLLISFQASESSTSYTRRPLNLSLVLDRSGSMAGQPLKYAIQAAQKLVDDLTPEDVLSVVIYDDSAETIIPPQPVQEQAAIKNQIAKISARGCTNLSGGWLMGCDRVRANLQTQRLNRVLLLTDGLANVGHTDPQILTKTAQEKAEQAIITTTLGFGTNFNEDLLINLANAGKGNFYFIQSPDDAAEVFGIEMESLVSVVGQNLVVTLKLEAGVQITELLNNYRSQVVDKNLEIYLGDIYQIENKSLALSVSIPPQSKSGTIKLLTLAYKYESIINQSIQSLEEQIPIQITSGNEEEVKQAQPDANVIEQTSQLRIAQIKEEAIALADTGDYQQASQKLRQMVEALQKKALEVFAIAEEISQLEYYAQQLESKRFDQAIRKEMRDQSYQARKRDRSDLKLRGTTSGAADSLEAVENPEEGILLRCERIGGKLRMRVVSEGYDPNLNIQFPRSIREENVTYVVDEISLSANGTFYRVSGNIRRVGKPKTSSKTNSKLQQLSAVKSTLTLADIETTDTVGNGVLIQCVPEGKKLRARVVSDGYDPNYNVRFPRDIRQEGILFVVDDVKEGKGGSYMALGKIRRLIQ